MIGPLYSFYARRLRRQVMAGALPMSNFLLRQSAYSRAVLLRGQLARVP